MQRSSGTEDLDGILCAFVDAQLAGDARGAILAIERGLSAGLDAESLRRGVIRRGQETIGKLWQEGRLDVAREHMATETAAVALGHLYWRAPTAARNGRRVVLSCVRGEQHCFAARLAADALDLAGYEVRFLGADVPSDSLAAIVRDEEPDVVALSVTTAAQLAELEPAVATVRDAVPDVPIVVGGAACTDGAELAERLRVIAAGRTEEELLATLGSLVASSA